MKKINPKDILAPTITLFVICLIVTALLALTNSVTAEPIEKNNVEKAAQARLEVLPSAAKFEEKDGYYAALDASGNLAGYVFSESAKGYGGDIEIMVGINSESVVTGVSVLNHNETPGLGANCTNPSFTDEYKQETSKDGFTVVKDKTGGSNGKIDALTGATISSNAVTKAVNSAIEKFNDIKEGAK